MTTIAQAVKKLEVEIQVKQNQLTTLLELMPKGNPGGYGKPKPSKPKPKGPKKPRKKIGYRKGASAKQLADEFNGQSVRGAMKEVMTFTNFSDKPFGMDDVARLIVNPKIRKPAAIRGCISVGLSEMPDVVTRVGHGQYQLKHAFNISPR